MREKIIDDYRNYLIRMKVDIKKIYTNTTKIEDIRKYEKSAKFKLDKLEKLSEEYKLYDSNYEEFMIAMGKFALGINKINELSIDDKDNELFIDKFTGFNNRFEELEQRNIMKDAYVWK